MDEDKKEIQERKTRLKRRLEKYQEKKFTDEKKEDFLELIANGYSATAAAQFHKINITTVREARNLDPDFDKAWTQAQGEQADLIEHTALQRALHGVDKPVWFHGERVGEDTQYDNNLLITMLKAAKPDKYKDRKEVTGVGGGAIKLNIVSYAEDADANVETNKGPGNAEPVQEHKEPSRLGSGVEDDQEAVVIDLPEQEPKDEQE